MRVNAYYILHYGQEYLAYSLASIFPVVNQIYLVYSPWPTHGHASDLVNPDDEGDLLMQMQRLPDTGRLTWIRGRWSTEGEHRDHALRLAMQGADMVLAVDSDEVWDTETLAGALEMAAKESAEHIRVPFLHFWRSFSWVCRDAMMPIRIYKRDGEGEAYVYPGKPVYHFGYAQRPAMVLYKASIHGHRAEWREGWFESKFLRWAPGGDVADVHPTCLGIWNPKPLVGWKDALRMLEDHPYWDSEIIV